MRQQRPAPELVRGSAQFPGLPKGLLAGGSGPQTLECVRQRLLLLKIVVSRRIGIAITCRQVSDGRFQ